MTDKHLLLLLLLGSSILHLCTLLGQKDRDIFCKWGFVVVWTFVNTVKVYTERRNHWHLVSPGKINQSTLKVITATSQCKLSSNSLKCKSTSSIRSMEPHHKHTHLQTESGQLIETGARVSPGSWAQFGAYGWALDVCRKCLYLTCFSPKTDMCGVLLKKVWCYGIAF